MAVSWMPRKRTGAESTQTPSANGVSDTSETTILERWRQSTGPALVLLNVIRRKGIQAIL